MPTLQEFKCRPCHNGTKDLGVALFQARDRDGQPAREQFLSGADTVGMALISDLYEQPSISGKAFAILWPYRSPRDPKLGIPDVLEVLQLNDGLYCSSPQCADAKVT